MEEALQVGFDLLRLNNYDAALALFTAVLEVNEKDHRASYGQALSLFNLGRPADAERAARTAIELSKTRPQIQYGRVDALVLLGVILAVRNDNSGALRAVSEAVALAPESFDAQFALGRALFGSGDPKQAAVVFRKAVGLRPDDAKSRFFLATALETAGEIGEAQTAYRELIVHQPDNPSGYLGLGVLLLKFDAEKTDEGIKQLLKAISLDESLYEARVTLGRTLIKTGRLSEAVEHLSRAAQLDPTNPEPHYQLAIAYRRLGKIAEAEAEAAKVKKINSLRRTANVSSNAKVPPKDQR
jgi:Flp pilus assembly protein TadD